MNLDHVNCMDFYSSVFKATLCFNIEPQAWKSLHDSAAGFGYQVVQQPSGLLISAPFEQYDRNRKGEIFSCTIEGCKSLQDSAPNIANMSLGLSMISDPNTGKIAACGPTVPKECLSITMYSGVCTEIENNGFKKLDSSSVKECQTQPDIAFVLDGSGSLSEDDFSLMKKFVSNMIKSFLGKDTQFAITQFGTNSRIHYNFKDFNDTNWEAQIHNVKQSKGYTRTALAITDVVDNVFKISSGSRPNAKKIMIIITDGESNDPQDLEGAIEKAANKGIHRIAIGVGEALGKPRALNELRMIASEPKEKHVYEVDTFDALEKIQKSLQDKLFSIEGSKTGGESLKMELSQEGFRAAYVPGGMQMTIVGANQWRGGYKRYRGGELAATYEPLDQIEPDSYLGYSMAVAITADGQLTIIGAPRYKHRGVVKVVYMDKEKQTLEPDEILQIGQYFGAEVCTIDVNLDSYTDLIIISAPMYRDSDREGRVYVCTLIYLNVECHFESPLVLKGAASDRGRFGSSLAALPDLNKDGFSDLAVGAPLENDGQGSIYIFHAEGGQSINPTYSQRIAASEVQSGLKFFGISISQSSFDQSNDGLPDLAVGSKGTVVLLRSKPIVMVDATVTFHPNEIPTQNVNCSTPLVSNAEICITLRTQSQVTTALAQFNYTLTLDATRKTPNNRAYISEKHREIKQSFDLNIPSQNCRTEKFFIKACPDDIHNPLINELKFTFDSYPSNSNLKASLSQETQTSTHHPLRFQINCGTDEKCVDNLKVDLNFTRSTVVAVGMDELLDVTVSVENREENSYNSHVVLTYPAGLSYRKFTALQGRIECWSVDSEDHVTRGKTDCSIDKPVFRSNSKAVFIVSYGIGANSQLGRKIFVTANAISGNPNHSPSSELFKQKEIDVKYNIIVSAESSLVYCNFTFGEKNLEKPVQQSLKVTNSIRAFHLTVLIRVPVKLGDKDIWGDLSSLQIADCQQGKDEEPAVSDIVAQIQKNKLVDCSVAKCRVFRCSSFMGRMESKTYTISANLSSSWIEQIGLASAKFRLISTASLEYDRDQYIFFSAATSNTPPVHRIETEVELYAIPDYTKEIVGGSFGGFAFLILLAAGLYKAGFFKSKYKDLDNENGDGAANGPEGKALKG